MSIINSIPVHYCTTCPADHRFHIDALLREQVLRCEDALMEMNHYQTALFLDCFNEGEETLEGKRLDNMVCFKTARYKSELFKLKQYQIAYDDVARILNELAEDENAEVALNRLNWTMDSAAFEARYTNWAEPSERGLFVIADACTEMCEAAYLDYDYITTGEVDDVVQLFLDMQDEPIIV